MKKEAKPSSLINSNTHRAWHKMAEIKWSGERWVVNGLFAQSQFNLRDKSSEGEESTCSPSRQTLFNIKSLVASSVKRESPSRMTESSYSGLE